jgi:soluble lytic murein transglycosylase-like protein
MTSHSHSSRGRATQPAPPAPSGGRFWGAIGAALLLFAAGGAARPVSDAATGAWQRWRAPERQAAEHAWLVGRLHEANPRLGDSTPARIATALQRCQDEHGISSRTTLSIMIVESGARPAARSPKGAIGLMQVMPHMFKGLGLPGNIAHIESNIEAGCLLLAGNIARLGEDDGISAYFWGNWIRGDSYLGKVKAVRERLGAAGGLG